MVFQLWPCKIILTFAIFFNFVTNWWTSWHFLMILYHKKLIYHNVLPDITQYIKLKVTPDKMVTFAINVSIKWHTLTHINQLNESKLLI